MPCCFCFMQLSAWPRGLCIVHPYITVVSIQICRRYWRRGQWKTKERNITSRFFVFFLFFFFGQTKSRVKTKSIFGWEKRKKNDRRKRLFRFPVHNPGWWWSGSYLTSAYTRAPSCSLVGGKTTHRGLKNHLHISSPRLEFAVPSLRRGCVCCLRIKLLFLSTTAVHPASVLIHILREVQSLGHRLWDRKTKIKTPANVSIKYVKCQRTGAGTQPHKPYLKNRNNYRIINKFWK